MNLKLIDIFFYRAKLPFYINEIISQNYKLSFRLKQPIHIVPDQCNSEI